MNFILGIDTSSVELGVGLVQDLTPVMAISRYLRNSHAEHITQCIDHLLSSNNVSAADIAFAGIAVGPGSFTGLRIGIAFLKGFFFGRTSHVLPISSLESAAGSWNADGRHIIAASDARNGCVFWARFLSSKGGATRLTEDTLALADDFKKAIKDDDIVLIDTLGYAKSAVFNFLKDRPDAYSVEQHPLQRGMSCALIAAKMINNQEIWKTAGQIVPKYLSESRAKIKS